MGAGVSVHNCAGAEDMAVGVIGAGGMGARHADNLHEAIPRARVGGVTDADGSRAEAVAARCGGAVYRDPLELIDDDGIDALVIASPDETHAALALECVRRRKPVLCEKPLATNVEDARRIVAAETDLGERLIQVGFMRRYDPQHLAAADALAAGTVGRPVLFKGWHRTRRAAPGTTTEFVLFNTAVHDLDAVRWLLRQEIAEVYVRGVNTDRLLDGVLDLQLIELSTTGGCLATLEIYVTAGYGYEVGVELVGERGTVHIAPPQAPFVRHEQVRSQRLDGDWLSRFRDAYVAELTRWVRAVHDGVPPGPDAWDGYASAVAADACATSLRTGTPARVPDAWDGHGPPALYASGRPRNDRA
ncbi:MAG: inositol 2-dehydrogenase [Streptosporangiales bacterium]|nr:inositol 2-dehydrogenase [Streptosporangiales bacterium]